MWACHAATCRRDHYSSTYDEEAERNVMRIDVLDRGLNKMAKAGEQQMVNQQCEGRGSEHRHAYRAMKCK